MYRIAWSHLYRNLALNPQFQWGQSASDQLLQRPLHGNGMVFFDSVFEKLNEIPYGHGSPPHGCDPFGGSNDSVTKVAYQVFIL